MLTIGNLPWTLQYNAIKLKLGHPLQPPRSKTDIRKRVDQVNQKYENQRRKYLERIFKIEWVQWRKNSSLTTDKGDYVFGINPKHHN